jgi:hypothetical protein
MTLPARNCRELITRKADKYFVAKDPCDQHKRTLESKRILRECKKKHKITITLVHTLIILVVTNGVSGIVPLHLYIGNVTSR